MGGWRSSSYRAVRETLRREGSWLVVEILGHELRMLSIDDPADPLTTWLDVELHTPDRQRYSATVGTPEMIARQLREAARTGECPSGGDYHDPSFDELIIAEPTVEAVVAACHRLIITGEVPHRLSPVEEGG